MLRLILSASFALLLTAGQAAADGLPKLNKAKAPDAEARPCSISGYVGFSSEQTSRGFAESGEALSAQGGFDLTCGRFYVGVAASSVKIDDASALAELSVGITPKTGPITWDFGVVYHAYNGSAESLDFIEIKAAASVELWKDGTLGIAALYSPEYGGVAATELGATSSKAWTLEGNIAQTLRDIGIFTPTLSATVGQVSFDDPNVIDYVYWNIGLTLAFLENWSVDLRYSDTNITSGCGGVCDERYQVTLRYTF